MRKKTVFVPQCIDAELALKILTDQLLGTDYVCCDSVCSPYQANAMVVRDVLYKYTGCEVVLLDGKVYGDDNDRKCCK